MDTYAADVTGLTKFLDLKNAIHVGHSTGGGETIRYTAQYGKDRVAKVVLISAITPYMIQDERNPDGVPLSVLDDIRYNTFSETDFTEDLKSVAIPVLVLHGEDDQTVYYATTAVKANELLKNRKFIIYPGFPHSVPTTEADTINKDILEFIQS